MEDLQGAIGLPTAEIVRRAAVVAADGQFAARVGVAMEQRYPPFEPAQVVDGRMYEGFPSRADESRMQVFHAAGWVERAEIAETIEDDRYRELARRIVFHGQPDVLRPELRQGLEAWLGNRLHGREGVEAERTVLDALSEQTDISPSDLTAQAALSDIRTWLEKWHLVHDRPGLECLGALNWACGAKLNPPNQLKPARRFVPPRRYY